MQPGRYSNLSNSEYHNGPGISKSGLDRISESARKYKDRIDHPENYPLTEAQKKAFAVGAMMHALVLDPEKFSLEYIVAPTCDRRTKEGKALWAEFEALSEGRQAVSEEMFAIADSCAKAVLSHPVAKGLLDVPGTSEESFYWRDEPEGVLCRCRPDFFQAGGWIVDLKTTVHASPHDFSKSSANFRYHVQAAYYLDGVEAVTGIRPEKFVFVAVEKTAPYEVAVYEATEDFIGEGRAAYRENLHAYAECFFSGEWPGYPEAIMPLGLPRWARAGLEIAEEEI
jgi:exodeoxyribonuclease VIII